MKVIIHILEHTDDLNHDFPAGERRVSLATPPHVADIIRLQLNDDAALFKIKSIQHHLTMQNSVGNDMEAETHVYLQVISKSGDESVEGPSIGTKVQEGQVKNLHE